jgi:alkylhydroperoxidase family enzyme
MSDAALGPLQNLWQAVTGGVGVLPASDRLAIAEGREAPAGMAVYLRLVRHAAHAITDKDVAALKTAGHDDEQIFEATVAAAVGAGFDRLHAAQRVLGGQG